MDRKKFLRILTAVLVVTVLVFSLGIMWACNDDKGGNNGDNTGNEGNNGSTPTTPTELDVPTEIEISSDGLVTWKRVSGATSYDININGTDVNVKFTRYDLYTVTNKPSDGRFTIKIRAVAKDGTKSNWSAQKSYTMDGGSLLHPVITGVENGVISWYANEDALSTVVTVNGTESSLSKDVTSYDLSAISGTEITFSVMFKGDGVYYKDSKVNTVIYYKESGEMRLPAPKNVHMEGQILKFDEVIGADIYYLRDYNNTVISVTTNEIDMSSGYLTKSVKAGITSGAYLESEETSVTYFGENSGTGTEDDPFIITTSDEFRYIEFYEGIGEAKYYELANDIVFEEIELKDDEFGSNAYKLGSFSGVLDGKNHSLKNITVYYRDGYSSLFSSITESAVVKNIVFDNANWRTWTVKSNDGITHEKGGVVAILTYTNRGLISNVSVNNSSVVAVQDGAAGLVSINRGEINRCVVGEGTRIYGNLEAGGIAIYNEGTISNCINKGTVEGNLSIGGIVGRNAGTVAASANEGTVSGIKRIGGIVGYNYNVMVNGSHEFVTEVRYCSNTGTVTGSTVVGGIVGQNGADGTEEVSSLSVAGAGVVFSYNAGNVKGGSVLGGIVGNNFSTQGKSRGVVGCVNMGDVDVDNTVTAEFTRVFIDASACSWVNSDDARVYCYYWGTSSSTWPGVLMNSFTYDNKLYYFVDINVETLKGIKFSRVGYAGTVYNSTPDLELFGTSTLYTLTSDFSSMGTWSVPDAVSENMPAIKGAICGYSAEIDDCYYLDGTASVIANANGDLQQNVVKIDGEVASSTDTVKTAVEITATEFVELLNSISDNECWKAGSDYPVFAWQ